MKLLSPNNLRDTKHQETERDIIRIEEVRKLVVQTNKQLADAQADFARMLAGQRERWAHEEEEHNKRSSELTSEISILETRKQKALEPIEREKEEADTCMAKAQELLVSVRNREDAVEEMRERLEDKLDDVGSREKDVELAEKRLEVRELATKQQEQAVIAGTKGLSEKMASFLAEMERVNKEIDERKTSNFLLERSLIARAESLDRREQKLKEWAIQLADQRETLERAFKRIEIVS